MHGNIQMSLNEARQRELNAFAREYAREAAATKQTESPRTAGSPRTTGRRIWSLTSLSTMAFRVFARAR